MINYWCPAVSHATSERGVWHVLIAISHGDPGSTLIAVRLNEVGMFR